MSKNVPEYDNRLFSYGDTEWSSQEWVKDYIYKDFINEILPNTELTAEMKGVIREAQLKRDKEIYIEYKVMLDTYERKRLFFETYSTNGLRSNEYRPCGYTTSKAHWWHIECYNLKGDFMRIMLNKDELEHIFTSPYVEVIDTPDKALKVNPQGMKPQYKLGYSVPFDVLLDFNIEKLGFNAVEFDRNEGRNEYRKHIEEYKYITNKKWREIRQ